MHGRTARQPVPAGAAALCRDRSPTVPCHRRALPHVRGQRPARSDGPGSGATDGPAARVPVRGQPTGAGPLAGAWPQTVALEPAAVGWGWKALFFVNHRYTGPACRSPNSPPPSSTELQLCCPQPWLRPELRSLRPSAEHRPLRPRAETGRRRRATRSAPRAEFGRRRRLFAREDPPRRVPILAALSSAAAPPEQLLHAEIRPGPRSASASCSVPARAPPPRHAPRRPELRLRLRLRRHALPRSELRVVLHPGRS
ncbi:hypothetical protein PVAP13_2NG315003 [Panicum virgatum]|uniref:Uncharacterized protein n=1 Tax=Panicum virgatum TaxID=38727 RepID=A0A8T0VFH6_PANVG|nr:hypothetical protein PVAP13_2NG315003 [Panicum virgatum]